MADDYGLGLIVRLVRPFVLFIRGSGTYLLAVYASGSVLWPIVARELSRSQQRRARVVFVRALCTLANAGGVRSSSSASSSRPSSARVSSVSHSSNWPTSSCIHTAPRSSAYSSAVFSSSHPMSSSAPVPRTTLPCAAAPHRLLRSATPHLRVTHALRFERLHLDLSCAPRELVPGYLQRRKQLCNLVDGLALLRIRFFSSSRALSFRRRTPAPAS